MRTVRPWSTVRIAVDARELCGNATGVGRYLYELLDEWGRSADGGRHDWSLFAHRSPAVPAAFAGRVTIVPGTGGTRWEQQAFPRALAAVRPDVLFSPGYTAPLTAPCPVALTIHDVSFCAHPEWFRWREGLRRRTLTRWSARRARIVVTSSEFSADEITRYIGIPAGRLRTIYPGVRIPPVQTPALAREPLVLYVGSIFERRHVDWLIRAFEEGVAPRVPGARLEIVGENRLRAARGTDAQGMLRPQAFPDRVAVRSYVDDATLQGLYARASVFAFLSEYEGFGLTPLEALAAGVAPVVLDTPVAREICGAAACYVRLDTRGPGLAAELVDLLTSPPARGALLRRAPAVLARYQWSRAAADTLAAIEEAAGAR